MQTTIIAAIRRIPRTWRRIGVIALAALLICATISGYALARTAAGPRSTKFPQSAAMENQLGVRFSRIAVVGDGGLITVTYVVLDSEKASRFQSDVAHPPMLLSESRHVGTRRVALMKQGHTLRAGQTYYLVYQNTRGALRPGERVTVVEAKLRLEHAPVL
jgi:hypothetical protein